MSYENMASRRQKRNKAIAEALRESAIKSQGITDFKRNVDSVSVKPMNVGKTQLIESTTRQINITAKLIESVAKLTFKSLMIDENVRPQLESQMVNDYKHAILAGVESGVFNLNVNTPLLKEMVSQSVNSIDNPSFNLLESLDDQVSSASYDAAVKTVKDNVIEVVKREKQIATNQQNLEQDISDASVSTDDSTDAIMESALNNHKLGRMNKEVTLFQAITDLHNRKLSESGTTSDIFLASIASYTLFETMSVLKMFEPTVKNIAELKTVMLNA